MKKGDEEQGVGCAGSAPADSQLPNALPRPAGELEALERVWKAPEGWRLFTAVNNTYIGIFYIGTGLLFLVLAGVLALIMRTQLAVPENDLVSHRTYNQLFTMHGTVMMFLFAVPIVEAVAVFLMPNMLGARDLPFPRLGAYAFWAYAIGGLAFFCTLFFGVSPDGGWFMYPPLTSYQYSPDSGADWWLLGIGFIEISAIAGAIEIIVGVMRTRAPGMSLDKMPVYAWAMLVVGLMIVFGFPPIILATLLLELERAFLWPFFVAEKGGDPVLWQHLFWLFGHPEVYVIFLPAAGMISMILPTIARTPLVAYRWVVIALLSVGVLSFGLWAHHMFATGMPHMSAALFSAASMAVAIPTGIQIFAWLATMRRGRVRLTTPTWFLLGFFAIFVVGGLTGVMLAVVPFDWQAHDSYFVVAHLHYVLIGGMVFPLFAALYYWAPLVGGKPLSERMGRWACGLMFVGFHVAFFPMHITGMLGMPRRVYTYPAGLGWDGLNMLSTIGAFALAAGIVVVLLDIALHMRVGAKVDANVWEAGTLEWLPVDDYAMRSIPQVRDRYPLWSNPNLAKEVESGQHYLPGTVTNARETLVTSPVKAQPQYLMVLTGDSWLPLVAGAGTAAFFLLLTVKMVVPAAIGGLVGLAALFKWLWETDRGVYPEPADIGGGIRLPVNMSGPGSHSWWAMIVLILVDATVFASLLFTFFYLWTVTPGAWPPAAFSLPESRWPIFAALAWLASSGTMEWGRRLLSRNASRAALTLAIAASVALMLCAMTADFFGQWQTGTRPQTHAYGAVVYAALAYQGFHAAVLLAMAGYTLARAWSGLLNEKRRATFENTRVFWHYMVGQGIVAIIVLNLLPRLLG
jgi:cytochrome c oxidase subunit I+III